MVRLGKLVRLDGYRRSMFVSYGTISCVFFILPVTFSALIFNELTLVVYFQLILSFLIPLFVSGYVLAPVFGPLAASSRLQSFFMNFVSLAFTSLLFLICQELFDSSTGKLSFLEIKMLAFWFVVLLFFGAVPAFFSSLFFSGLCEKLNTQ